MDRESVVLEQVVHAFLKAMCVMETMTAGITATRTPTCVVSIKLH